MSKKGKKDAAVSAPVGTVSQSGVLTVIKTFAHTFPAGAYGRNRVSRIVREGEQFSLALNALAYESILASLPVLGEKVMGGAVVVPLPATPPAPTPPASPFSDVPDEELKEPVNESEPEKQDPEIA